MKLTFTRTDVQKIFLSVIRAFVSTFHYISNKSDDLDFYLDNDLLDFDPSTYGCAEITESVCWA